VPALPARLSAIAIAHTTRQTRNPPTRAVCQAPHARLDPAQRTATSKRLCRPSRHGPRRRVRPARRQAGHVLAALADNRWHLYGVVFVGPVRP